MWQTSGTDLFLTDSNKYSTHSRVNLPISTADSADTDNFNFPQSVVLDRLLINYTNE